MLCCLFDCFVSFICSSHSRPQKLCILTVLAHSGVSSVRLQRLQGSPWETPWPTWWETWGPICYAHRCFSVSHCSLLNVSLGVLGTYLGAHKHRKSRILRVLAYLGASSLGAMRLQGLLRRLLGRPVGRPRAPYAMHTDVSAFLIVLC